MDLISDGSLLVPNTAQQLNDYPVNNSYRGESVDSQSFNFPKLDLGAETSQKSASRSSSLVQFGNEQKGDKVYNYIKNLERFCNEILENKLLWTPEVIDFFGIKDDKLLREYEQSREAFQRQKQNNAEGRYDDYQRGESYANLDSLGNEIIEETGETGGIDSKKSLTKIVNSGDDQRNNLTEPNQA